MSKPQRRPGFESAIDRYAFSAIRCRTIWLADAIEMHRDIAALKVLLQMALSATTGADMQVPLRLATELLALHVAVSRQVLAGDPVAYEAVMLVAEQLEGTDPDDPLYVPRAAGFKSHVDVLLQYEEELIDRIGAGSSADAIDDGMLQRRTRLLGDIAALTGSSGRARPPMTWLQ